MDRFEINYISLLFTRTTTFGLHVRASRKIHTYIFGMKFRFQCLRIFNNVRFKLHAPKVLRLARNFRDIVFVGNFSTKWSMF